MLMGASHARVERAINLAPAALAQRGQDFVMVEALPGASDMTGILSGSQTSS